MATIEDMDAQIKKATERLEQLKARKESALAKQREQEKKWMESVHAETGRAVIASLGCDWAQLDIAKLRAFLEEHADEISGIAVAAGRTPKEAKEALDSYRGKKSRKNKKAGEDDAAANEERPGDERAAGAFQMA